MKTKDQELRAKFISVIREEMEGLDLNRTEMALMCNLHPTVINQWFTRDNHPSFQSVIKVYKTLGRSLDRDYLDG